ncbi:hypothetical protein D3C80_2175100 [compost metagenome]
MYQVFQARVVHHQHAAGPGVGAEVDGQDRTQAIAADQHLLAFAQDLFLRTGLRMSRHRRLQHA